MWKVVQNGEDERDRKVHSVRRPAPCRAVLEAERVRDSTGKITVRVAALVLMAAVCGPSALRAGVVLEAGAIDSSSVAVGAFVVVIYGQGEQHPVSGEWESLTTARGYIRAVDWERRQMTLALGRDRDRWPQPIALHRIQTLVLVSSPSPGSGIGDRSAADKVETGPVVASTGDSTERVERGVKNERTGIRIIKKVVAGTLSSIVLSAIIAERLFTLDPEPELESGPFGRGLAVAVNLVYTNMIGFPIGVSSVDPHDSFYKTLLGGILGGLGGFGTGMGLNRDR